MSQKRILEELIERALSEGKAFLEWLEKNTIELEAWQLGWVRGLALREASRFREAESELSAAIVLAENVGTREAARIRSGRSLVHLALGNSAAALEDADWASRYLEGAELGRNHSQRAGVLYRMGRHDDALDAWHQSLELLELHGDDRAAARLRRTRGAIHGLLGDLTAARDDLRASLSYAVLVGDVVGEAISEANLGFVEGRAGDVPRALAHFDRAEDLLKQTSDPARLAESTVDRAEVLADAGLLDEALARIEEAITSLDEAAEGTVLADARLLAARLQGMQGRHEVAVGLASHARRLFHESDRPGWAAKAAWVEVTAKLARGDPIDLGMTRDLAEQLAELGWHLESQELRLATVDASVQSGNPTLARELVGELRRARRDLPALMQVGRHRAIARTRLASGDHRGARRAITAALKLLHEHRLSFGSAELRAHASRHGQGMFDIAMQLALESDRPDDALVMLDLLRDTEQPVWSRPPSDPELARDLEQLRRLDAEIRDAAREGTEDRAAMSERSTVEKAIRERLRQREGDAEGAERVDVVALQKALDGRVLRSWFVYEGQLGVVTVDEAGRRLELLGPSRAVIDEVEAWRFALRRLIEGTGSARKLEDAASSALAAAARLTTLLGLDEHPPTVDLVVVPTGILRGLAWHALPVLAGAQVNVVPSARYWLTQSAVAPPNGSALVAAGPGLAAGAREVKEVASRHADAVLLMGDKATASAVIDGLDGAAVGHLAAHGTFRWDNPLFSALQFADGPVWLHDFERLERAPGTLVLSSCDMAMDRVVAGDAVVGLASGLLRLGVRTLIAPVVPVPDEEVADFMVALHERMATGDSGAGALAATAAAFEGDTPRRQAVRQAFVSFGV